MTTKLNALNAPPNNARSCAMFTLKSLSLFISATFLLMGCASLTKPLPPPIQGNLVTQCEPIKQSDAKTLGDLIAYTTDLIGMYGECSAKHKALVLSLGE